jgi:perosamine synthetase
VRKYISGKSTLWLRLLVPGNGTATGVFPLDGVHSHYFFSSRYALTAALSALDIKSGDKVLFPSYNCGTEVEPFVRRGVEPIYFRIGPDLRVDLDDIVRRARAGAKAVMVTHYLGFPQPVDELMRICKDNGLLFIEDCAHAFLSSYRRRPLGSFGDASFFSLMKTLPVPNGGVLVLGNSHTWQKDSSEPPSIFPTLLYAVELMRHRSSGMDDEWKERMLILLREGLYLSSRGLRLLLLGYRKVFRPEALFLVRPDSYLFHEEVRDWGMSSLSRVILRNVRYDQVFEARRRNFQYLLARLGDAEGISLPFTSLPEGVCPLFFPMVVESPAQRDMMYAALKKRGIVSHPWWKWFHPHVPWDAFPEAVYLKQRLFGLPIHQDLTVGHLERVVEEFQRAFRLGERR